MGSINKASYGLELWRSQLDPSIKLEKYIIISFIVFIFLTPIFFFLFFLTTLTIKVSFFIFLIVEGILSLVVSPLILFSIRYFLSFLIIYEKGVVIREMSLFKLWKRRYIPFEDIENLEIGDTFIWKEPATKVLIKKLVIQTKGKKTYQITSSWVYNLKHVKELLINYRDKYFSQATR